jgi:hypothetical protein
MLGGLLQIFPIEHRDGRFRADDVEPGARCDLAHLGSPEHFPDDGPIGILLAHLLREQLVEQHRTDHMWLLRHRRATRQQDGQDYDETGLQDPHSLSLLGPGTVPRVASGGQPRTPGPMKSASRIPAC